MYTQLHVATVTHKRRQQQHRTTTPKKQTPTTNTIDHDNKDASTFRNPTSTDAKNDNGTDSHTHIDAARSTCSAVRKRLFTNSFVPSTASQ